MPSIHSQGLPDPSGAEVRSSDPGGLRQPPMQDSDRVTHSQRNRYSDTEPHTDWYRHADAHGLTFSVRYPDAISHAEAERFAHSLADAAVRWLHGLRFPSRGPGANAHSYHYADPSGDAANRLGSASDGYRGPEPGPATALSDSFPPDSAAQER